MPVAGFKFIKGVKFMLNSFFMKRTPPPLEKRYLIVFFGRVIPNTFSQTTC